MRGVDAVVVTCPPFKKVQGEIAMVYMKKSGSPKKKTKGPRIALHLPKDAQGLYTRGLAIWSAIKADAAHFPNPYPPAAEIDADLTGLGGALQAAVGGDPIAMVALQVAADKVRQTLELLGRYVQSVVRAGPIEDAPAIISSVLMYESNVGQRPPKPELDAKQGTPSGIVRLIALAVASAMVYYWEYSLDQQTWTADSQTAQAQSSIVGLTSGKAYSFRFRAFTRASGMTDDSQIVSLIVM
jgi:hypothetical protein